MSVELEYSSWLSRFSVKLMSRAVTHSNVWHNSFICATWLTRTCDLTRSCVWHHPRSRHNVSIRLSPRSNLLQQFINLPQQHTLLQQHSNLPQQHSNLPQQHSNLLQQFSSLRQQHSNRLQQHSNLRQQHSNLLQQYCTLLGEYVCIVAVDCCVVAVRYTNGSDNVYITETCEWVLAHMNTAIYWGYTLATPTNPKMSMHANLLVWLFSFSGLFYCVAAFCTVMQCAAMCV